MIFSDEWIDRYSRQIILPEVGGAGQEKLSGASVLIVGAGGLGSPASLYLAAAGVGRIGIVDSDRVELSNLQKQIIHGVSDIGKAKAASAKIRLGAINPDTEVVPYFTRLTADNIIALVESYDLVIDGSDNFPTRYLVNDACVLAGKPLLFAAILGFDGQAITILPGASACLRCIFPAPPPPGSVPTCQEAGVIGSVAGIMGMIQALEAVKLILGVGEPLTDRMLFFDGLSLSIEEVHFSRNTGCAVCGDNPSIRSLRDFEDYCESA